MQGTLLSIHCLYLNWKRNSAAHITVINSDFSVFPYLLGLHASNKYTVSNNVVVI